MRFGDIKVDYIAHVSFVFRSPGGAVLITDPFFAGAFEWQGHIEQYLSPPTFPPEAVTAADAIFISHIHGDHYDPDAVSRIRARTGCRVLAPQEVVEDLLERDEAEEGLVAVREAQQVAVGDLTLTAMTGYDDSVDAQERPNKFSLLIEGGTTRLFYSGDCHNPPPALRGQEVDAIFLWPHPDEEKVEAFARGLSFRTWVLMHGDRFAPGDFLCNLDMAEEQRRIQKLVPTADVVVPTRLEEFPDGG